MAGSLPKVGHIRESFVAATQSAEALVEAVSGMAAIHPQAEGPRLHPEHCRRIVELAFLGLISAWEEFLEQSFVRYLAGAKADNNYAPTLRLGKAASIKHSYHLVSGDPAYDPTKNYSKFGDPKWVIAISKNYFEIGAPYATKMHPNLQVLQEAIRLRNRVAHNSGKSREDFKRSARIHLGLAENAPLVQGYGVGDLLTSKAKKLFGQQAKDSGLTFFSAYTARLRRLAKEIAPET